MNRTTFSVMTLRQKIATIAFAAIAVISIAVVIWLAWELFSGRLDHADNPNYRGSITITEAPKRLLSEVADTRAVVTIDQTDVPLSNYFAINRPLAMAAHVYYVSLSYQELENFLQTEEKQFELIIDLATDSRIIFVYEFADGSQQIAEDPTYSGDFYVTVKRAAAEEMFAELKLGEQFVFSVAPTPLTFHPIEQALRAGLFSVSRFFDVDLSTFVGAVVISSILLIVWWHHLWKYLVYFPTVTDNFDELRYNRC